MFSYPAGYGQGHLTALTVPGTGSPGTPWATISLAAGAPLAAVLAVGGYLWTRRRGLFQPGRP